MPRMTPRTALFAPLAILLLAPAAARSSEPEYKGLEAASTNQLDCAAAANTFDPFDLAWVVQDLPDMPGFERTLRCATEVRDGGVGRKGVKVTLDAEIVDLDGNTLLDLPRRRGRSNNAGYRTVDFTLPPSIPADFGVVVDGGLGGKKQIDTRRTSCTALYRKPCVNDDTTLCLAEGRFKVGVEWSGNGRSGEGFVQSRKANEGTFYFLNPNQTELVIQLLNQCRGNDHFWVFASALTSFEYDITVTDTLSGEVRTYDSPLGQPAQPVQDTAAFATCP